MRPEATLLPDVRPRCGEEELVPAVALVLACIDLGEDRVDPRGEGEGSCVSAASLGIASGPTERESMGRVLSGLLALVVLIDAIIYFFAGRCLVCYRCRTEFRDTPIRADQPGWELATGEKYRQVEQASAES